MATIKGGLFTKGGSAGGGGANGLYVMFDGTNIVDNSDGTFGFKKSDISSTMNIQSPVAIEWTFELQKGDVIAYLEDLYAVIDLENASDDTFVRVVQLSSFGLTQNPIVSVHTTGNNVDYFYIKTKGDGGTQYMVNCGGGGSQLYQHNINITITGQNKQYVFEIINTSNTQLDYSAIASYLYTHTFTSNQRMKLCNGFLMSSSAYRFVIGLFSADGTTFSVLEITGSNQISSNTIDSQANITDIVVTL